MAWIKNHWAQIAVGLVSIAVALGLHFGKLTADEAIAIGTACGAVGLHLPALVYKVPPPKVLGSMLALFGVFIVLVFGAAIALMACSTVARTAYGLELDACIDQASTRAAADTCVKNIQLEWTEAGAAPALVLDGGVQ